MTAHPAVDVGWVAGVIDTRGYIAHRTANGTRLPTVSVTLADIDDGQHPIVAALCAMTGVRPVGTGKGYNRNGCTAHCPEPHVHVTSRYHRWQVGGAKAVVVLSAAGPRMVTRAAEVAAALESAGAYKAAHVREMRDLGWPTPRGASRIARTRP